MLPGEAATVGDLRVGAYQAQDHLAGSPGYADTLRTLGLDGHGTILVAADDPGSTEELGGTGELLGTVMLEPWHTDSEVARSADEAEVRALAVAPWAQGRGVGRTLMRSVIDEAAARGAARLLLSTQPGMEAAQHLYRSLGFTRTPELDWTPVPGVTLLGFALPLA
ncbi:MAG TPA: GNAT family N-acetyltransferase [Trebonia sp.]